MSRAKRGVKARRRRNKILKASKGFVGGHRRLFRTAVQSVRRSWRYAYRDRRVKKREFRRLWIVRINAAARKAGTSYSKLMGALSAAGIELDRKVLADIAVRDFATFQKLAASVA
ncbi:MAG: 50S ribosomal protein L20 [Myxococcales bacterium]|nr:50S ribosomal protein L20 [Myxococcales bacterium]